MPPKELRMEDLRIRSFNDERDQSRIEELERKCEAAPMTGCRPFLFTDTMGDPLCRIRNSPAYKMLVAELGDELVGVVGGSIRSVSIGIRSTEDYTKVGYILGLRVSPLHRRRGIGVCLVRTMEEWFTSNLAAFAYMATERHNAASIQLFTRKLGFLEFRSPSILVNPVGQRAIPINSSIEVRKLEASHAEHRYNKFMSSAEFFPKDIDQVLANNLTLGTWVASRRGHRGVAPSSWAMLSVWDCGEVFKLRVGRTSRACALMASASRLVDRVLPCLRIPAVPDVFSPFGLYFMYGVHGEGPEWESLVRPLCGYVHNMAMGSKDCRVVAAEVGDRGGELRDHIPHWPLFSCSEDLWCIKALQKKDEGALIEWIRASPPRELFVDPREL